MLARRPGLGTRRRVPVRVRLPLLVVSMTLLGCAATMPAHAEVGDRPFAGPATGAVDTTPLPPDVTRAGEDGIGSTGVSATGAIAKMVVGLAVVLAVIFGVYWLLKSAGKARRGGTGRPGLIDVVSTAPLAPGRSLHLVRVGEDIILVGAAEHAVGGIRSWTGDEARRLEASLGQGGDGPRLPPGGGRLVEELRRRTVRG